MMNRNIIAFLYHKLIKQYIIAPKSLLLWEKVAASNGY